MVVLCVVVAALGPVVLFERHGTCNGSWPFHSPFDRVLRHTKQGSQRRL